MSKNLLTSEGLIAAPGSSKAIEEENMDTSSILDDFLSQSGDDEVPSFQVPNDTSPEKQTTRPSRRANFEAKKADRRNENPRKRRHSQPPQTAENKIYHQGLEKTHRLRNLHRIPTIQGEGSNKSRQ